MNRRVRFTARLGRTAAFGFAPVRGIGSAKIDGRRSDREVHKILRANILETVYITLNEPNNITHTKGLGSRLLE
jgi:hypothetical protein